MLRKPLIVLCSFGVVLGLAACGGDSGSSSAPKDTGGAATTASSGAAASDSSGSAAVTDATGSGSTTAVPNFSGKGGAAFCNEVKSFQNDFANSNLATSSSPADLKKNYQQVQDALKKLESSAPNEIKADVKTVADAIGVLTKALDSVNYDVTKLASDPQAAAKLQSAVSSQQFQDASKRLDAYGSQVCGISTTDTTP
jgi:hypothetical protein